jgi:hypothetical protein
MTNYVEVDGPRGVIRIKPEWMIALGEPEPSGWIRAYMHGGAQLVVLNTPENVDKLLERTR